MAKSRYSFLGALGRQWDRRDMLNLNELTPLQKKTIDELYENEKTGNAYMALRLRIAAAENSLYLKMY